ncbi:hydrogenase [Marinicella rhabdoformis]|uniref:hydrogenase n=1 Tax=Marinicella rhabdoformis TaxID=2580566 RepID=UPI0012AEBA96|nr:hydrogenase [Marinicella rhabdoformis]
MNRNIIRHGFIIMLLSMVTGMLIPSLEIPRLGLSAHTVGILSGILLLVLGAIWHQFDLSQKKVKTMYWCWLFSSYFNWLACLLGAIMGAGKATPIAAAGYVGENITELVVLLMFLSVALTSLIAVILAILGLKSGAMGDG